MIKNLVIMIKAKLAYKLIAILKILEIHLLKHSDLDIFDQI